MKIWQMTFVVAILIASLAACGGGATAVPEQKTGSEAPTESVVEAQNPTAVPAATGESEAEIGEGPGNRFSGDLPENMKLSMGILSLEGTEQAITPDQAASLLPLWKVIQGGTLSGNAEMEAVLRQVGGTLTAEQLAAIDALEMGFDDMQAWAEEQGIDFGAGRGEGAGPFGGEGLSEEERAQRREQFQGMSDEERQSFVATAQASGDFPGGGFGGGQGGGQRGEGGGRPFGGGLGQLGFIIEPLVDLLTIRAGE